MNNQSLALSQPAELYAQSTDVAGLCKDIVVRSALDIQGRKYVRVEGWQSIATAHGCLASSRDVERVEGGYRAIGEVRRMSDGALLASAEGFVGEDEPTWFGGEVQTRNGIKTLPKRPDYAIRAMTQTRAISRACRSAFAHVVVLMDAGLSTTPAEEVPQGGFDDQHSEPKDEGCVTNDPVPGWYWKEANRDEMNAKLSQHYQGRKVGAKKTKEGWRVVVFGDAPVKGALGIVRDDEEGEPDNNHDFRSTRIHFGKNRGLMLSELTPHQRAWYMEEWMGNREAAGSATARTPEDWQRDLALINALKSYKAYAARDRSQEASQATETAPLGATPQTPHEGSWKLVPCKFANRDATLDDLIPAERDELREKLEKQGTRNLYKKEKHLLAALTLEYAERQSVAPSKGETP